MAAVTHCCDAWCSLPCLSMEYVASLKLALLVFSGSVRGASSTLLAVSGFLGIFIQARSIFHADT
ncbi:hypothetical protein [Nitrosomonas communis]|uniref:hypothetical protein n=1 Tax=Nitrosomonas communis TaxID=44574 RepID=UPI0026EBE518|nr:hypothetical protein [Nitrosomonas communis]MCO6427977.1 hypothetical protein [Nitrosomonas communis]